MINSPSFVSLGGTKAVTRIAHQRKHGVWNIYGNPLSIRNQDLNTTMSYLISLEFRAPETENPRY